jgi:hypothetical protein
MNRYFYYLIFLNMLVNVLVYVPSILLKHRFEGAVLAIPMGIFIGSLLIYVFQWCFNHFPFKDLPEILSIYTPGWVRNPLLVLFGLSSFVTGMLTIIAFNNIAIRFINPDFAGTRLISVFIVFIIIVLANLKTDKILYTLEIMLVLSVPLIAFITYQAYRSDYLTWNSVLEVLTHWREPPSFSALSATIFTFSGFFHLVIFYRALYKKVNIRMLWMIPLVGTLNLATTFFIPIAMHGADGVGDYTFPWVVTSDSLQIEYGPIERASSPFLLLYISIAITSVVVKWHVAVELLLGIPKTWKLGGKNRQSITGWIILISFGIIVWISENKLREADIFRFGEIWLSVLFSTEVLLVLFMWFVARRKRLEAKK